MRMLIVSLVLSTLVGCTESSLVYSETTSDYDGYRHVATGRSPRQVGMVSGDGRGHPYHEGVGQSAHGEFGVAVGGRLGGKHWDKSAYSRDYEERREWTLIQKNGVTVHRKKVSMSWAIPSDPKRAHSPREALNGTGEIIGFLGGVLKREAWVSNKK